MRSTTTITALAALLAFSAAQSLSEVPECAQSCFMDGVSASGCGLLDAYCQCTEGAEALRATTIGCLCKSECTATDLMSKFHRHSKKCLERLYACKSLTVVCVV